MPHNFHSDLSIGQSKESEAPSIQLTLITEKYQLRAVHKLGNAIRGGKGLSMVLCQGIRLRHRGITQGREGV